MKRFSIFTLIILLYSLEVFSQNQQAGDVAPDAKILDADRLTPFNEGYAVIEKGNAAGIIDDKTNFLIPYHKYRRIYTLYGESDINNNFYSYNSAFVQGLAIAENNGSWAYINTKGKEVFKVPSNEIGMSVVPQPFISGKAWINGEYEERVFLRPNGTKFSIKIPINESLEMNTYRKSNIFRISCSRGGTGGYRFVNVQGKEIIGCIYQKAGSFSEGLAKVMKKDQFGEEKWGYIDSTGKQVIDFVFSKEPGDFSCGRAFVIPKESSEFSSAFIDRKGEVKIKITNKDFWITSNDRGGKNTDFINGYIKVENKTGYHFLDTTGKILQIPKLKGNFTHNGKTYTEIKSFNFVKPYFEKPNMQAKIVTGEFRKFGGSMGIADIYGNILLPPVFKEVSYIDPVSGLAYAIYEKNVNEIIEGYVNKQGVFVIIKGKGSKW